MFEGSSADAGPPGDSMYQASTPPNFLRGSNMSRPPFRPPYGMMRPPMRGGFMPSRPRMKPMMSAMGMAPMMSAHIGNGEQRPAIDPSAEIWVETQTKEGKAYFYNAKTRASAWTRPSGDGVQVLTQEQLEQLAKGKKKEDGVMMTGANGQQSADSHNGLSMAEDGPPGEERPPGEGDSMESSTTAGHSSNGMPPPGSMGGPPSSHMGPYGMRPPFGMPAFGGPPFGPPPGFNPGFNPGGPPFMMMPPGGPAGFHGGPGMFGAPGMQTLDGPPGKTEKEEIDEELGSTEIDAEIKRKADEWKEYKTPEGKAYFHSTVTNQSVWDRPQALLDLDKEEQRIKEIRERNKNREETKKAREVATAALANPALAHMSTPQLGLGGLMSMGGMGGLSGGQMGHVEPKEEKPKDMTKPVSSTPVSGTPWCVVWTGDGKVFFFNPATRTSVWERPPDLQGRSDVDKLLTAPPSEKKTEPELPSFMEPKKATTNANAASAKVEEPFYKKMRTEGPPVDEEKMKKPVEELVKEDPMAAEKKAAKERALIPLEERMAQFRQLLVEKAVSAFSPWEKELHKIVFDARYLLLASRERKQVFEKYCKEKVDEERKEKKNKAKQLKESFKELLEASNLSTKSSFSDFASKHGKDERFKGVDKMRDRENLFNDFIANLKRRERDEKNALKEKLRKDFIELLKEQKLDRYSSWTKTKDELRHDPRYQAIESSTIKEEYFREHCGRLSKAHRSDPNERDDSEERQKKERAEASIRQREKEVAESLSVSLKQRDREREHHRHEEARQNFQALLSDLVRSSDISWHDAKKMLKKDHRYESVESLDKAVREKMFDDHVSVLKKKKKDKFKQMLAECAEVTLNLPFKDARKYIKDDPRYSKYSSSEHKCEKVYKDWMKEQVQTAMNNFRALLAETKLITYKSKQMIEDSDSHLRDILSFLENDKRYLVLSELQEERLDILMNYIDGLHNKGAPPPPTASDPSKRNK